MVSIEDFKKEIKDYNLNMLTGGDVSVIQRSIDKAVAWIKAKSKVDNFVIDFDDPIIDEVLLKRGLYELYSYAENELIAKDKKQDAYELLKGYLKNSPFITNEQDFGNNQACHHIAVVKKPEVKNENLF